ncbi:xanthine dehydrogenase family protein molybdopterin-binding subunit [Mycobacterium asiaticum]|uniref:Carbon monoxide dehydrogenase n=1 Tax=Mycobacterium asiaticum TaxID=1790 RepID=A0A1A3C5H1_MYCAS|nr:xanthine dehydrogenase family protein molybdopterin-binding subunit [Mycobacterium asiaticum]OBI81592.1 carbon monoxide dehydrogenase [Mycobacterium asiaticum]
MREQIMGRFVGARVRRVEDHRLLRGRGRYVDDVVVPDMAHAAFVRSPWPHALIRGIDTTRAAALPGVYAILTGRDIAAITNPLLGMFAFPGLYDPWHWALAVDRVRLVGDPVAIVIATSRALAEDAAELVDVEYEELQPIATVAHAHDPGRPAIWPKANGNVVYAASESFGDIEAAFAGADRVISETFRQHRHANQPMETRGTVAEIDADGNLTLHAAHQAAHAFKWAMAMCLARQPVWTSVRDLFRQREQTKAIFAGARDFLRANPTVIQDTRQLMPIMLRQIANDPMRMVHLSRMFLGLMATPKERLPRVVTGDIGGAFGAKTTVLREDIALGAAALRLGRSIKWIEDRNEHLVLGAQARDEQVAVEAAVRNDGTVRGLRAKLTMDGGAYPGFPFGAPMFCRIIQAMFPGPYRFDAMQFDIELVASNKPTYVAYRGPWAVETWVRERLFDVIARELGLSRAQIRLRNIVGPDALPTKMLTGPVLDVRMSAKATLEKALEIADFEHWAEEQAVARAQGRRLGLGIATYIEAAPGPPGYMDVILPGFSAFTGGEPIHAVLEADGSVTVHTRQIPHGQGHETTLAQVAADELGVPVQAVRVRYGDTNFTPFGIMGTGGSRSAAMAGGAVGVAAHTLREHIVDIAADLLEASPADIVIEDGEIHVAGVPAMSRTFQEVAQEAIRRGSMGNTDRLGRNEAIRVHRDWNGGEGGWAQSTHVCWVDVDLETGQVKIPRYAVVEDCGEMINPAIVEGQIRGGVAQGVGAVFYEKTTYGEDGQPRSGTFMDYLIPTTMEIPEIEIHHIETPSDIAYNYRGVGEGGMIGAPAAITNAVEDALADLGVRITEQHLPPTRILELAGVIPERTD